MAKDFSVPGNDPLSMVQKLDDALKELMHEMRARHLVSVIDPYDGNNPNDLKRWLEAIDSYRTSMRADSDEMCRLVYETSRGIVSRLIERHTDANPQSSWEDMETELTKKITHNSDCDCVGNTDRV